MSDLSHKFKEFKNIRTNAGSLDDYLVHTHVHTHTYNTDHIPCRRKLAVFRGEDCDVSNILMVRRWGPEIKEKERQEKSDICACSST